MNDQPKEYRVESHAFIGYVLVDMPAQPGRMGMPQKPQSGWMKHAIDLRAINSIKEHHFDHPERTALYHNDAFVCAVNCPYDELLPHWLAARSLFDNTQDHVDGETEITYPTIKARS